MLSPDNHSPNPAAVAGLQGETAFRDLNGDLIFLPQDILCSEATIREKLEALDKSPLPLAAKVAEIEKNDLWPFLTGSRLKGEFRFLLDISDSLDSMRLYKIDSRIGEDELNGKCDPLGSALTLLAEIPNPRLLFSAESNYRYSVNGYHEMLTQLYAEGKRITRYRGVTVTWDQSVDRKVWTTNIDTVNFINELSRDGVFDRKDIRNSLEIGVGGAAISKTVIANLPDLEEHTATDISPYALMCARRNIEPVLKPGQKLNLYLGKGLRSISAETDLLLVNPPYIPHVEKPDAVDPYRGTGLIKEIVEIGAKYLNPSNPDAAIYMGMSSLAERDLREYLAAGSDLKVTAVSNPLEVPLKILDVNEKKDWIEFLEKEHNLIRSGERLESQGFEFWHKIYLLRLSRA